MRGFLHCHAGDTIHHRAHAERLERILGLVVGGDARREGGQRVLRRVLPVSLRCLRVDRHPCWPSLRLLIALRTPAMCSSLSFSPSKTWLSRILRSSICCRRSEERRVG